jgi:hypothetical protein
MCARLRAKKLEKYFVGFALLLFQVELVLTPRVFRSPEIVMNSFQLSLIFI